MAYAGRVPTNADMSHYLDVFLPIRLTGLVHLADISDIIGVSLDRLPLTLLIEHAFGYCSEP